MIGGATPLPKILGQSDRVGAKSPIFDLFSSDSAVTPSEKSSINANRKSTTRFPMSLRWTSYVVRKPPPPKGAQKRCVQNLNTAITPKLYEMGCQLLLITNRKFHTWFRLVPILMTLNDLERRNSSYFAFFPPDSIDFQGDYITVVEDRRIMSVKYCLPVSVYHFWLKL